MEVYQIVLLVLGLYLIYCIINRSCAKPTVGDAPEGCFLKVNLPQSIDFDQAQVIIYAGGQRHTQFYAGQTLHFDFGEECNPDELRVRTRDGKRYKFMYPGVNTTWTMPDPMPHFSYYDPDFLASLRRD